MEKNDVTQSDNLILSYYNPQNVSKVKTLSINFMKVRTGSKEVVMAGDEVNQTLTLTNRSEYDISNISIKDTISSGVTFKANSVAINGTSYSGYDPTVGFTLPDTIKASNSASITYRVFIDTQPETQKFSLYSAVTFTADGVEYTENSTVYNMKIASGDIKIETTSNKTVLVKGQTITYQSVITNTGNLNATKITFKDELPSSMSFVEGSVKINGVAKPEYNPIESFSVNNLYPNDVATITFDAKLN